MSGTKKSQLRETIRKSLGMDDNLINESYVAQVKQFNLPTELLSSANKRNHDELYHQYVKDFNRISAELDTADRENVNSNHSEFRSLKLDETYKNILRNTGDSW